jgi:cytochrome P450
MRDCQSLSVDQILKNSGLLIIGGSETTATLLSGVTFLLLTHPETLRQLTEEVRTSFAREEDIDFTSMNKLSYMTACLDEALRIYPPVPGGLPRVSPKGGSVVSGRFIPEKASLITPSMAR